jgi:serine/threonine protein kinase
MRAAVIALFLGLAIQAHGAPQEVIGKRVWGPRRSNGSVPVYRIGRRLGEAINNVVHEGYDEETGERVALKIHRWAGPSTLFDHEAAVHERLAGAHTALPHRALGVGRIEHDTTRVFIMDFAEGVTLREHMESRAGKLSLREASQILYDLLDGASAMAARGVEHEDIWNQNIFVSNGRARYVDFGASSLDGARPPGKALPDAYTLGLTAAYLLTGRQVEEKLHAAGDMIKAPALFFADPQIGSLISNRTATIRGRTVSLAEVLRKAVDYNDHYETSAALREALAPFLDP